MAKSTKSTSSKTRSSKKAPVRSAAKKGAANKRGAGSTKRTQARSTRATSSAKRSAAQRANPAENWAASVGSLLGTQLGREILADVLDAAAAVLRRNRELAQSVAASGEAALEIWLRPPRALWPTSRAKRCEPWFRTASAGTATGASRRAREGPIGANRNRPGGSLPARALGVVVGSAMKNLCEPPPSCCALAWSAHAAARPAA
jgi:hypothetical protein